MPRDFESLGSDDYVDEDHYKQLIDSPIFHALDDYLRMASRSGVNPGIAFGAGATMVARLAVRHPDLVAELDHAYTLAAADDARRLGRDSLDVDLSELVDEIAATARAKRAEQNASPPPPDENPYLLN